MILICGLSLSAFVECPTVQGAGTVAGWGFCSNTVPTLTNISAIAGGGTVYPYSLGGFALRSDGIVVAWKNTYWSETNVPPGLTNVVAIATSGYTELALKGDGTVIAWGGDFAGQTNIPAELTNVVAIAIGRYHCLALQADGRVIGWGDNTYGQITIPPDLSNVVEIACCQYYSMALRDDGTVAMWGYFQYGNPAPPESLTNNVVAIVAGRNGGGNQVTVLKADGTVAVWAPYLAVQLYSVGDVVMIAPDMALTSDGRVHLLGYYGFSPPDNLEDVVAIAGDGFSPLALIGDGSPSILRQPVRRASLFTGRTLTLQPVVSGDELLSSQWYLNGTPILNATNSTLMISNAEFSDSGDYILVVSNSLGVVETRPSHVMVRESPPWIRSQSTNQAVSIGAGTSLQVVPEGSGPLSCQWRFNNVPIPNATNATLVLPDFGWENAGIYTVLIANGFGAVTSAPVRISLSFDYDFAGVGDPLLWDFGNGILGIPFSAIRGSGTNISIRYVEKSSYTESRISLFEWIEVRRTDRFSLSLDLQTMQLVGVDQIAEKRLDIFWFIFKKVKDLGTTSYSVPVVYSVPEKWMEAGI